MAPQRAANELEQMSYVERQQTLDQVDRTTLELAEPNIYNADTRLDVGEELDQRGFDDSVSQELNDDLLIDDLGQDLDFDSLLEDL